MSAATGTSKAAADEPHHHADVSGGWLRPAVFGAMDGLVTNIALIAGVGGGGVARTASCSPASPAWSPGAISMGLGEYTSRAHPERAGRQPRWPRSAASWSTTRRPRPRSWPRRGSPAGCPRGWPAQVATVVGSNPEEALRVHAREELGVDPDEQPSPWVAAFSSFVCFSLGALVPLLPYLLGATSLWLALAVGWLGLFVAGRVDRPLHQPAVVDQRAAAAAAGRGRGRRDLPDRHADRGQRRSAEPGQGNRSNRSPVDRATAPAQLVGLAGEALTELAHVRGRRCRCVRPRRRCPEVGAAEQPVDHGRAEPGLAEAAPAPRRSRTASASRAGLRMRARRPGEPDLPGQRGELRRRRLGQPGQVGVAQLRVPAARVVQALVVMYWSAVSGQPVVRVRACRRYSCASIATRSTMTPLSAGSPGAAAGRRLR